MFDCVFDCACVCLTCFWLFLSFTHLHFAPLPSLIVSFRCRPLVSLFRLFVCLFVVCLFGYPRIYKYSVLCLPCLSFYHHSLATVSCNVCLSVRLFVRSYVRSINLLVCFLFVCLFVCLFVHFVCLFHLFSSQEPCRAPR